MTTAIALDEFTQGYIAAALWSTNDESTPQGGEPLDSNYDSSDIDPETLAEIVQDCKNFQLQHAPLLDEYYKQIQPKDGATPQAMAGHDYWLTRNGHGCGFWDRDIDEQLGQQLTEACKKAGEVWWYVGDSKKIYQS